MDLDHRSLQQRDGRHSEVDVRDHVAVDQRSASEAVGAKPDCDAAAEPQRNRIAPLTDTDVEDAVVSRSNAIDRDNLERVDMDVEGMIPRAHARIARQTDLPLLYHAYRHVSYVRALIRK